MFIKTNNNEITEIKLRKTKKKERIRKKRNETGTISEYEKTNDILWQLICLVSEGPFKWQ